MKNGMSLSKKILGGMISVLLLSAVVISCDNDDNPPAANNNPYALAGIANGNQMKPDTVKESGTATITGSYDPVTGRLIYTSNWASLTGEPIGGGLYSGAAGSMGTIVDSNGFIFDSVTTNSTGNLVDTLTITSAQATELIAGNWYYLFKTAKYPEGEVRGQITATR